MTLKTRPLASSISNSLTRQRGFGLLEISIVAGLSIAVAAGSWAVWSSGDAAARAQDAATQAIELSARVQGSYRSLPNFDQLNETSALRDGIFPKAALDLSGQPSNGWGGSIQVAGTATGYALTYEKVGAEACQRFVIAAAPAFSSVTVNGQTVASRGTVDQASLTSMCGNAPEGYTVQFNAARLGIGAGVNPDAGFPCVPGPDQLRPAACPTGQLSSIAPHSALGRTETRSAFCNLAYGSEGRTPWTTASNTCVPACVAPATVSETGTLTASCPGGQVLANGATSFTQSHARPISYSCPLPIGAFASTTGAWGVPTPAVASVCAPACVAPAPKPGSQTVGCPAGQSTATGAGSYTQTNTTTYACGSPQGQPTATISPWTPAPGSVCAPVCVAPAPITQSQSAACPAGQLPTTYTQTRTVTYSCSAPTGQVVTNAGPWSSGACAPAPSPPAPACAVLTPANYTVISRTFSVRSVDPSGRSQPVTTDCSANMGICNANGGSSQRNLELTYALVARFNNATFSVTGSGIYNAGRSASITCGLYSTLTDGCSLSGSLPPGLTVSMSAFSGSQAVTSLGTRACP